MTTDSGTKPSGQGVAVRLMVGLLLLNGFLMALALFSVIHSKADFEEKARLTTQNLARMLDQSMTASVGKINLTLLSAVDELERQLREQGRLDAAQSNAFLLTHQRRLPELSSLLVSDASGRVVLGEGVANAAPASWTDRDMFRALRDERKLGLVVTNPILGRVTNLWVISIARRYNQPDGRFAGVVSAAIPVSYLGNLLSAIDVGPKGIALLRDANLGMIVRHPAVNSSAGVMGDKGFSKELGDGIASGQQEFSFHSKTTADNVERTGSYRRMSVAPFHIVVGLGSDDYLAAWRVEVEHTISALALFLLVSVTLGWLLWRSQIKRNQAVAQRDQTLSHLQKIASRVPGMVYQYLLRPDGSACFPYASDAIRDIYRVSPEDVREDAAQVFANLHPDDFAAVASSIAQSAQHLTPWLHEYRVRFADGTVRWLQGSALPDRLADGSVLWHGFITDISGRKQTEIALRDTQAFAQEVLDSMQQHIAVIDPAGTIVEVNARWRQYSRENSAVPGELAAATDIGTNYLAICSSAGDDALAARTGIQAVLEGHLPSFSLEYPCHSPHKQRWFAMSVNPLRFGRQGAVIAHSDITRRKQTELALLSESEALMRSNAELEQYGYVASHDLRQPLRMVTCYMQMLEQTLADKLDDETREMMHFATDGARRMDQMLVSLLEYSRVGRKGEPMHVMASRDALDEALLFLAPAIAQAQATVRVSGEWPQVLASPDEFTRLWQNLIGNAVKYRAPGRLPEIDITVTPDADADAEARGCGWRFCVADNGIGIDPAQFARLFKVFQRLHPRDEYEGSGIGLAVARKIVERHGGRIWIESAGAGLGSRFCFNLFAPPL